MARSRDLPPAIAEAVDQTEQGSEILISWIQLGFVVFIGALYFLSPKGHAGNVPIRPVPLALALYAPFVLLRLFYAIRRKLSQLILYASILMDILLITGLLWAYHIQYQQPPGFYLKAPTAMYFFLFIALRSLRFDPRYLLVTGIGAVVGWASLTVYALRAGSGVADDFVSYIRGTEVLIGAQVDKIVALIAVTLVLAVAVKRSSGVLITSFRERTARTELSRYFSPDVIKKILDTEHGFQPGQGQVRTAATLMIDLRGFSRWTADKESAEVMGILAEYQAKAVPLVLRHNGSVDKFMGDGILCHFGAATDSPRSFADALECAEAIHLALTEWKLEREANGEDGFDFGMGIAGGRLMFGAVGDGQRLEFTVIGTPVNIAAKLEKHAKRLRSTLLATDDLFSIARQQGFRPQLTFRRARGQVVDGLSEPLDLVLISDETH